MRNYSTKNDSYLIDILFMTSKEFRFFGIPHLYLFSFVFFLGLFLSIFINSYLGFMPFSRSMVLASPSTRLMNDIVIIYSIIYFLSMFFKWFFVGFSQRMSFEFKRYEKWFWENRAEYLTDSQLSNRKNGLLFAPICLLLLIPFMWIHTFGFDDGGNSPKMQETLKNPSFFIYFYMIVSYIASLFTIIFSIASMELRKYVL